jgi:hypothetical protein
LNGFGTTYYGRRYPAEDGSYVTTLWVTALWVPLLPLASYRVLPVGKGTNWVVHSSKSYQTLRVPFCWPQVRNVFLFTIPILGLILYFNATDIQKWWKEDVLKSSTSRSAPQPTLKPEPPQAQPFEADVPLDSKAAAVACGKVLKLDKEAALQKLNLLKRLAQLIVDSGITEEELKELGPVDEVQKQVFEAYGFGYLTWDKAAEVSRADFDKMVVDAALSVDSANLSSAERERINVYLVKFKRMMLKAFDLGRHDAKISPCQFRASRSPHRVMSIAALSGAPFLVTRRPASSIPVLDSALVERFASLP